MVTAIQTRHKKLNMIIILYIPNVRKRLSTQVKNTFITHSVHTH